MQRSVLTAIPISFEDMPNETMPVRWTRRQLMFGLAASPLAGAVAEPAPRFTKAWGRRGTAEGEFDIPIGIAISRSDEIFVTEFRNNRVQRFDTKGRFRGFIKDLSTPGGIAVDRWGRIFVALMMAHRIEVFDRAGKRIGGWGAEGTGDGQFQQPGGIAIGHDGSVYVADQVGRRVQRFTPEGRFLGKWGEYGVSLGQFGGNEAKPNRTGGPQFIAVDRQGYVYATEASMGRIQKFTPEGRFVMSWGDNSTGPGGFGGRPKNLPGPIAICVDHRNRIWVSATNHRVQCFTSMGEYLGGITGEGAAPGQFHTPHGLAVDSRGLLYVCDTQNARIQVFDIQT